jgi:hypothetical protein
LVVRLLVLGGTGVLVARMMLKRAAARRKKEEIFEDMKRSVSDPHDPPCGGAGLKGGVCS